MKRRSHRSRCFAFGLALVIVAGALTLRAEERLWIDCQVNGQPVKLVIDTGAADVILFRSTAERLGLKVVFPSNPGSLPPNMIVGGITENCEFTVGDETSKGRLRVYAAPDYTQSLTEVEGVIGWRAIRRQILWIDANKKEVKSLLRVPASVKEWRRFRLDEGAGILALKIPNGETTNSMVVDTGKEGGIGLVPGRWQEWKANHEKQRATLSAAFMPAAGWFVEEQFWADKISIGPLQFKGVPITEAQVAEIDSASFEATLGMTALKHMQIVVDGIVGYAYVKMVKTPQVPYEHNRLGAVFIPKSSESGGKLFARVASRSPAQKAGVRNGDVLLKINGVEMTDWRTNVMSLKQMSLFETEPVGAKLKLTLLRGKKTNEVTATLENILGPKPTIQNGGVRTNAVLEAEEGEGETK